MAALLHAGSRSLLTAHAALRRYGILPTAAGRVDVLVPGTYRPADVGYVRIRRTWRMPVRFFIQGRIRFTTIPRAVTDAALLTGNGRDMRAIVAVGVDRAGARPRTWPQSWDGAGYAHPSPACARCRRPNLARLRTRRDRRRRRRCLTGRYRGRRQNHGSCRANRA